MTRKRTPAKAPQPLVCVAKLRSAVTYSFRTEGRTGWALCTVNDDTCELSINSDYGKWSHRWHKSGFEGTFSSFLADISSADYLADKLCVGDGRSFDAHETVKQIRRRLCQQRIEDCHEMRVRKLHTPNDRLWSSNRGEYDDFGCPIYAQRVPSRDPFDRIPLLTKALAKRIWDDNSREDSFLNEYVCLLERGDRDDYLPDREGVYECLTYGPSVEWTYLHDRLLPALIKALQEDLATRTE